MQGSETVHTQKAIKLIMMMVLYLFETITNSPGSLHTLQRVAQSRKFSLKSSFATPELFPSCGSLFSN